MAQSVEQLTRNEQVGGSIPPSSSITNRTQLAFYLLLRD